MYPIVLSTLSKHVKFYLRIYQQREAMKIKISPALMNKYYRTIIAFRPNKLLHDEGCFQERWIAPQGKQISWHVKLILSCAALHFRYPLLMHLKGR